MARPDRIAVDEVAAAGQLAEFAHPTRGRILEACTSAERTNQELAVALGLDPATTLFHVRRLVDEGLLEERPPRRGVRGAREKPYAASAHAIALRRRLRSAVTWQAPSVTLTPAEQRELQAAIERLVAAYATAGRASGRRARRVTVTIAVDDG